MQSNTQKVTGRPTSATPGRFGTSATSKPITAIQEDIIEESFDNDFDNEFEV